jgi:ABC-type phosphate transport system substrate-binding protein
MKDAAQKSSLSILAVVFTLLAFLLGCGGGSSSDSSSTTTTTTTTPATTQEDFVFRFQNSAGADGRFQLLVLGNGITQGNYETIIASGDTFQRTIRLDSTTTLAYDVKEQEGGVAPLDYLDVSFAVNDSGSPAIQIDITQVIP